MTKMSAKRHLRELQWRLMLVAAFFIIGACLAYSFQSTLIPALLAPLHGEKLVYLNPAGGFSFIFLISIYAGIALAFPVLLQQLYAFLRPVLPVPAQKKSIVIISGSLLLLIGGIAFGYFVAVPSALTFLYGFADQYVTASLTAESYLNFMIAYTIGIGIVFQVPLLLLLIDTIKPLTPGGLMKSEKWVVLLSFIAAAIITPTPDPINQAIIAGPVVVVYQIGVVAVLISIARRRRAEKREERKVAAIAVAPVTAIETSAMPQTTPIAQLANDTSADIDAPLVVKTPHTTTAAHAPTLRTIDGIVRRPAQLHVPQRDVSHTTAALARSTPQQPPANEQKSSPRRNFYVDGITRPQQATSF